MNNKTRTLNKGKNKVLKEKIKIMEAMTNMSVKEEFEGNRSIDLEHLLKSNSLSKFFYKLSVYSLRINYQFQQWLS